MAAGRSSEPLTTGVEALDRTLNGGFLPGSLIAYCVPPDSQSELLLYELTAQRPTLYLTAGRSEPLIREDIEQASCPTGEPEIQAVGTESPIDEARSVIQRIDEEANLIIDPIDSFEKRKYDRYQNFLNAIANHMSNTGGIAIFHGLRHEHVPEHRAVTKHSSDVVLNLYQETSETEVVNYLAIPKYRGGTAPDDTVKLEMTNRLQVDTSRDIA